jgi:hypothetical protein
VTGDTWVVRNGNEWGPDRVGWLSPSVTYYRDQSRAPCEVQLKQDLAIDCPSAYEGYTYYGLKAGIGRTTVSTTTDQDTRDRSWP